MKKMWMLIMLVMVITSGCTTVREVKNENVMEEKSSDYDFFIKAIVDEDYMLLRGKLTGEVQAKLTLANFERLITELKKSGEIVEFQRYGMLEHGVLKSEIWRVRFQKESITGEQIINDKLLRIVIGENSKITGFSFQ